ncbi:aminopeptidase N [Drosophila novamexicana]|uniref:aminopeptidase N n=1 Tax=Drosophila novamexicana TaxID=47314 RepID=UPI0011E5E2CB|nr:aminopeptidase N [Drosophila novamexicana]XP_030557592.1 aminopeptidase N [Drosophila novamexicana]
MNIFKSNAYNLLFFLYFMFYCYKTSHAAVKRSIDTSASYALLTDDRLPTDIIPQSYEIHLEPNYEKGTFSGHVKINLVWKSDTNKIALHAHFDLNINDKKIVLRKLNKNNSDLQLPKHITVQRGSRFPKKTIYIVYLTEIIKQGSECVLEIPFEGYIWESAEGLFKGSYSNLTYLATSLRPNNARRLFPCFDEPRFKVPFTVSITRSRHLITIFNTPVVRTCEHSILKDHVIDHFEQTPPMSTFSFGFVTSELFKLKDDFETARNSTDPVINLWSFQDRTNQLQHISKNALLAYKTIQNYFGISLPMSKIDVVVIPELPIVRPVDNWGLLLFKESVIIQNRYYDIAQELIYQWIGSWVTPEWWTDAHLNKALASFLASETVITLDGGVEFNGKYPMTTLYSLYYEFSKRYPHSRITAMKQETISYKTELVIRMLNFTLGKDTFQKGLKKFIEDYQYKTFVGDDLWSALTAQALKDGTLKSQYRLTDIVGTWLAYHRLPVITVHRDYETNTATIQQKVYLRERPHDVPEQDKMLWWIPIIINRQDTLNFSNSSPYVWMEKTQQININNMPGNDQFIIINQEEIGPFPVNYDELNWKMLSTFLQTEIGRTVVPTYTRAKLLHDAWNLAYAGDLSFATAFNMTLFMKFERNHIIWNPVFTFIDQIGRRIDMSEVHNKFEEYVLALLTPLYEELGAEIETEDNWKKDLRSLTKRFLCRSGFRPCIREAMNVYKVWQNAANPNLENPVPNHYICPVFKWGSTDEWQFGLERVIQFPKTRIQSERTYLLKMLAGCSTQSEKIYRLLELSIFEEHSNFTENDQFLIFSSLTGSSSGYYTLFNFLSDYWTPIRQKFKNKTNLWDHLIGSATGFFLTQKGYDMVKELYDKHSGEFGSAQHIIEKSLRNIREEALWSKENLPVIETWLNNFLSKN